METTERIVEAYVRYVKGWASIPNIRCEGQSEIDLLAINLRSLERYHIESGVSVSGSYSKLTARPFSTAELRDRVKMAGQRRTLGYFIERKFEKVNVIKKLQDFGFNPGEYKKVIVSWGWADGLEKTAARRGIELWDFRKLVAEIAEQLTEKRTYFTDDTIRTLHLFARAQKDHVPLA